MRCEAEKNNPLDFHATSDGFSSKAAVSVVGVPPLAGTVAINPLV